MDYKNGKIYKIVSDNANKIYIGSTTQKLCKRIGEHRSNYKHFQEGKTNFVTSLEIIKLGNYCIVLIENFPCDNKEQLHARERYYIELNKNICVNNYRREQINNIKRIIRKKLLKKERNIMMIINKQY